MARSSGLAIALVLSCAQGAAQNEAVETNLDIYRQMARQISSEIVRAASIDSGTNVSLSVFPKENALYIERSVRSGFSTHGLKISADSSSPISIEIGLIDGRVRYENIRREGFLGSKMVDRTVELSLAVNVADRRDGSVRFSDDIRRSSTDTVNVSAISEIESQGIPITRGVLPSEGLFSHLIEPLILLSSVAVAVLLLFNVRS